MANKLKLLILTQYYPPETGAPQNRLHELAVRLMAGGIDVSVLTAMPNYPKGEVFDGYKDKKFYSEEIDGIKVFRSSIYTSRSKGIARRLLNYFSFVWSSYKVGSSRLEEEYDYILCESPPLFLGMSAWRLCKRKNARLIFNVSDLWPESAEKLGLVTNKLFLGMAKRLEERMYSRAALITGQTQGIVKNISLRFPDKKVYWLPNGVDTGYYDPEKVQSGWRETNGYKPDDFILLYAGILGHAQGLEVIVKAADELKKEQNIQFLLLGDGPEKARLLQLCQERGLTNVHFHDLVPKKEMPAVIKASDVAVVPLKKLDLFKGAIPSKIFESLAMKRPVLLGVEGEAKELFIDDGKAGLAFEPENDTDLARKILYLFQNREELKQLGDNGREYVQEHFNRDTIVADFLKVIEKLP